MRPPAKIPHAKALDAKINPDMVTTQKSIQFVSVINLRSLLSIRIV
jgi:hypothetical protein